MKCLYFLADEQQVWLEEFSIKVVTLVLQDMTLVWFNKIFDWTPKKKKKKMQDLSWGIPLLFVIN